MAETQNSTSAVDPLRRRPLRRIIRNWLRRHRHPFNFWIHMLGIPLAVVGVVLFFIVPWYWALASFLAGYALQFWGHAVEGNDVGEWAAIKKLLGRPYVAAVGQPNDANQAPPPVTGI
jgi:hypothetical protein